MNARDRQAQLARQGGEDKKVELCLDSLELYLCQWYNESAGHFDILTKRALRSALTRAKQDGDLTSAQKTENRELNRQLQQARLVNR